MCLRQRQVGARHGTIRPLRRYAEHIFELSHIARPIVSLQHFDGFVGDRAGMNGAIPPTKNLASGAISSLRSRNGGTNTSRLAKADKKLFSVVCSCGKRRALADKRTDTSNRVPSRREVQPPMRTASSISSATGEAHSISSTKRLPPSARSSNPAAFSVPHKSVCAAVPVKQDPATTTKGREARALFS